MSCPVKKRKQSKSLKTPEKRYVRLRPERMKSPVALTCRTSERKKNDLPGWRSYLPRNKWIPNIVIKDGGKGPACIEDSVNASIREL